LTLLCYTSYLIAIIVIHVIIWVKYILKSAFIAIVFAVFMTSLIVNIDCTDFYCKSKCSHSRTDSAAGDKSAAPQIFITKDCCCGKQSLCVSQSPVNAYIVNVSIINNIKYGHSIQKLQFLNDYTYLSPVIQRRMDHNRFSRLNIKTHPLYLLHSTLIC
jgi:hypothetical protein